MKQSFTLILAVLILCTQSYSQTSDKEAIKKVCVDEYTAYSNFDYDAWAGYHVKSADEQLAWNNPDGSFGDESGWDKISQDMKDYFKSAKKENVKLASDNFTYVIKEGMAFASFSRTSESADGKTTKIKEYRTLLKVNGHWKILAVQAYIDYPSGK